MQSKRLHATTAAERPIWRADNPNYPGIPQEPEPPPDVLTRATSRATVEYETYVLAYAAQQRGHVLLLSAGVVVTIGAAVYLTGHWLIILAAIGIGMALAGSAGYVTAADAHASYTRDLAVSVSETYEPRQKPAPPPATVRPFVASANTTSHTTSTGRLDFTPEVWRVLFDRALANGGVINRDDVAKPARVGREWYHGDGYGRFLEELTRLGFIDGRNRLTPAALAWYADTIPLPLTSIPVRSRNERTNERTNANERGRAAPEWGEP